MKKVLIAIDAKVELPKTEGIYHTIVTTGLSNFNETTYFNGKVFNLNGQLDYKVKYWYKEVNLCDLDSEKILPLTERIDNEIEKNWAKKNFTNSIIINFQEWLKQYHESLESAELKAKLSQYQNNELNLEIENLKQQITDLQNLK